VESQGLHLTVGDNDKSPVLEAVPGLRRSDDFDAAHWNRGREGLDLLDHHGTHFVLGVSGLGIYGLYNFAVIRADEEHVVSFATGCFHLWVNCDLREPVAGISILSISLKM
jgi:hypothetical protein